MVFQPECPGNWEYEDVADKHQLVARTGVLLLAIRTATAPNQLRSARDTRQVHGLFFRGFTPEHFPYFAGHYRGEPFRCLDTYEVAIKSDWRVGHTAATVPAEMDEFGRRLEDAIAKIDHDLKAPNALFNEADKLVAYMRVVAALFVYFLEIHPYANGNGHMGRTIVLLLLGRQGIYPSAAWNIDPRPADPPYSNLIAKYRDGDHAPLVQFLIDCL